MLWNAQEIDLFLKEKAYIDTVVIPLLPVSISDGTRQEAEQAEFISLLTAMLERQFKGRMLLIPAFTYMTSRDHRAKIEELKSWCDELSAQGFAHTVCITSDTSWKGHEEELDANIIWMPSIPLHHMDDKYKRKIVDDQVNQLIKIIVQKWQSA
ncbi:DUF2487 family protein [Jeotgalibacillus sp. S-D1]|uniref:YpiF family protein n=1 Tax=Jeotgalibacillus sp. S-D1 TaxID=2552189 RepID=UPI00105958C1|nr:YpiF family protein [Jeotgalibacillus sp. S-D1]TDL34742.1 DUF2487 family protein [Jeotgalibacillus sp. S-D1]